MASRLGSSQLRISGAPFRRCGIPSSDVPDSSTSHTTSAPALPRAAHSIPAAPAPRTITSSGWSDAGKPPGKRPGLALQGLERTTKKRRDDDQLGAAQPTRLAARPRAPDASRGRASPRGRRRPAKPLGLRPRQPAELAATSREAARGRPPEPPRPRRRRRGGLHRRGLAAGESGVSWTGFGSLRGADPCRGDGRRRELCRLITELPCSKDCVLVG